MDRLDKICISICSVVLMTLLLGTMLLIKSSSSASIMLAQIAAAYAELDPRDSLSLPDEQKEDCLEWAFGKDWEYIDWKYRDDKFRDLHPELDPNDFAGYTEGIVFWKRLEKAYLKETKK